MTHNAVMQFSIFYVVDPGLSPGEIAGIVVGIVGALLVVTIVIIIVLLAVFPCPEGIRKNIPCNSRYK